MKPYCKDCSYYTRDVTDPIVGFCKLYNYKRLYSYRFQLETCKGYAFCGTEQPLFFETIADTPAIRKQMAVKYNVSVEALRYYVKNDLRKDNDGWKILD